MQQPSISVLITCYNLGAYLDEAVQSVLRQTCQDFEILVVDDGSDDLETLRLVSHYDRPRTRVFHEKHRGLAGARNFLIARATGTFLCALDADDRLHPSYFEKALRCFEDEPSLTFVSSWIQNFGTDDRVWRQEACELADLLAEDTVMTAALVRREAVVASGGYDEGMPAQGDEDWALWLRLVERGHRGRILREPLFFYRQRPGSMSQDCTAGHTHVDLVRYLFRKHRESYNRFALEVLRRKELRIAELLRRNDQIEIDLWSRLKPEIERRRAELDELTRRVEALPRHEPSTTPPRSDQTAANLAREVEALRQSWSWRITAPLRRAYDAMRLVSRRTRV
jgi:glycosyltransferase involved in cell wall biosynthesis